MEKSKFNFPFEKETVEQKKEREERYLEEQIDLPIDSNKLFLARNIPHKRENHGV